MAEIIYCLHSSDYLYVDGNIFGSQIPGYFILVYKWSYKKTKISDNTENSLLSKYGEDVSYNHYWNKVLY